MRELRSTGLRRGLVVVAVSVGAAAGVALLGAGVAYADDPVQLKSRLGGNWCLDGPGGAGAAAVVNPCSGSGSQRWVLNAGQIESASSPGNCLGIKDGADNTPVVLVHCRAGDDRQQWTHQPDGKMTSQLGPCLNVFGGVAQPGTPVIAYHLIPGVEDEEWDAIA